MTTTLQEALLTAALDASSHGLISGTTNWAAFVATSISTALAQQGEPVAYMDNDGNISDNNDYKTFNTPLYAAPAPQAQPESITCDCGRTHKRTAYGLACNEPAQPVAAHEQRTNSVVNQNQSEVNDKAQPVKLYAGPPDASPTEKRFFDANGTEYTLMNGCIANCIFVGFEKLVDIGLAMKITEEPGKVDGITFARMEIVEIEPVAAQGVWQEEIQHERENYLTFSPFNVERLIRIAMQSTQPLRELSDEEVEALWDTELSADVGITALRKIARAVLKKAGGE